MAAIETDIDNGADGLDDCPFRVFAFVFHGYYLHFQLALAPETTSTISWVIAP